MAKIGTSCKECCFYVNQECRQGLFEIFNKREAEITIENESHYIDRLCQYKRYENWETEKEIDEKIKLCKQEVYIKGTIVILTNNKDKLSSCIDQLNANERMSNFKFIIIYSGIKSSDMLEICGNKINSAYKLILMNSGEKNLQIYTSLKYAQNGYLFIVDSDQPIEDNLIDKVNNFVNNQMYRLLHIRPSSDNFHQSVSMAGVYKWLKGDLQFNFADKLLNISEEEKSDAQVFDWGYVNEKYCN
jgi:hypothetical protein